MPERTTASSGENLQSNVSTSERIAEMSRVAEPIGRLVQIDKQIAVNNERSDAIEAEAGDLIRQSEEIANKLAELTQEAERLDFDNEKLYEEQARIADEISKNALHRKAQRRSLQQGVQTPSTPVERDAQQAQAPAAQAESSDKLRHAETAPERSDFHGDETEILSKALESQMSVASLSPSGQPQTIAERASFDSEDPISAIPHSLMGGAELVRENNASLVNIRSQRFSREAIFANAHNAQKANVRLTIPPMPR